MNRWTAYYKIMLDYNGKVEKAIETDEEYEFIISFTPAESDFWATLYHALYEGGKEPIIRLKK